MTKEILGEIEKYLSRKNVYFSNFSIELQAFLELNFPQAPTIRARWYMLKNNMSDLPLCSFPKCKNKVKWNERNKCFDEGCCTDHNKRITSFKNFGTEHPNQSKKQKLKVKKSMQEKYGVDYITQTNKHKDSVKETVREKYGVDNILQVQEIREKIKQTNLERYGYEECIASPEIREKSKQTNLKKFGVEESLASPTVREKVNKTNLERYGSIFPMRNEELLERRRRTIIEKYDAYSPFADEEIVNKVRYTQWKKYYNEKLLRNKFVKPLFSLDEYKGTKNFHDYEWECKKCCTTFKDTINNGHIPRCPTCFPKDIKVSKAETNLFEAINVENKMQTNRDLIENFEIDIYLSDYNIGVEYNGMYWHSEQRGIEKYYHLDKTILCENESIFLIHIFESEWINRPIQVISMIERHLDTFDEIVLLNDLDVREITEIESNKFLIENTLNLSESLFEKRKGVFRNNELLAMMTTEQMQDKIIITKFEEKMGVGFDGNVFKKLMDSFDFDKSLTIYYYPDRRYNKMDDETLLECGFSFEGGTEPNLWYSKNLNQISSYSVKKKNIFEYVDEYDDKLTIYENMIANGYLSIWDCGKLVFKKT